MAEKLVLSFDKSKQADEYIKIFIEKKKKDITIKTIETTINSLKDPIGTFTVGQIDAFRKRSSVSSDLKKQLEIEKEALSRLVTIIQEAKPNLIQMYDAAYEAFIENKITPLTENEIGRELGGKSLALAQQIKNEADLDYNARHPNDLSAKRIATSGNRLAASYYVNEAIRKFDTDKINKVDTVISNTNDSVILNKLNNEKNKAIAEHDLALTQAAEKNGIYTNKQSNETPLNSFIPSAYSANNLQNLAKEVIKADAFKPLNNLAQVTSTTPTISVPVNTVNETIGTIVPVSTTFVPAVSPSVIIPANRGTQLISSDLIDPRQEAIIVPVSRVVGVPAYIKKYSINGDFIDNPSTTAFQNNGESIFKTPDSISEILSVNSNLVYNQFTFTGLNKSFGEKVQIEEVFSAGLSVLAFGAKPKIWQISGTLINDVLSRWKSKFEEAFHKHLRISVLAKQNAYIRIVIPADLIAFNCYPLDLNVSTQITSENLVPFTMPVLVVEWNHLPEIVAHKNFIDLVRVYNTLKKQTDKTTGNRTIDSNKYGTSPEKGTTPIVKSK